MRTLTSKNLQGSARCTSMAKNAAKPYLLRASSCSPMAHIYGGDRKDLPVNLLEKKARLFPSAVHGVVPVVAPATRRSGDGGGRRCSAVALRAEGDEEARRQSGAGKKEAPPLPPFIGEAW